MKDDNMKNESDFIYFVRVKSEKTLCYTLYICSSLIYGTTK